MKGVILCGGNGTRLAPLTNITNKHLLPIYNKPMVFYPIETLVKAGIKEILVIVSGPYAGDFIRVLKNGTQFGLNKLEYAYQESAAGIADALSLAENFAQKDNIAVILGDNTTDADLSKEIKNFKDGAHLFLKKVNDPERFGVAKLNKSNKIIEIIEKPINPPSNFAITGVYLYDNKVFDYIKQCSPSQRGELEISTVNSFYLKDNKVSWDHLKGFWQDAGTIENLYLANKYWFEKENIMKKKTKENKSSQVKPAIVKKDDDNFPIQVKSAILKDTKVLVENGVVTVIQENGEESSLTVLPKQLVVIENGLITVQAPEDVEPELETPSSSVSKKAPAKKQTAKKTATKKKSK